MLIGLVKVKMFAGVILAALFAFKNIVLFGGLLYPSNHNCHGSAHTHHNYPSHTHSPESYDYIDSHDEHYGHHGHHDHDDHDYHYDHLNDQIKISERSYNTNSKKFNNNL